MGERREEFDRVWYLTIRDLVEIAVDVRRGNPKSDVTFRDLVDRELGKRGYVAGGKGLDVIVAVVKVLLGLKEEG